MWTEVNKREEIKHHHEKLSSYWYSENVIENVFNLSVDLSILADTLHVFFFFWSWVATEGDVSLRHACKYFVCFYLESRFIQYWLADQDVFQKNCVRIVLGTCLTDCKSNNKW